MRSFSILLSLLFLAGCASMQETGKKIWGTSIAHLEKARQDAKSDTFAFSLPECFERTLKALQGAGADVYLKDEDKKYMAAMKFKGYVDTTQAGIFFTALDERRTRVEVSSMSPDLASDVAEIVFSKLREA